MEITHQVIGFSRALDAVRFIGM